jgi:hypothetical protein
MRIWTGAKGGLAAAALLSAAVVIVVPAWGKDDPVSNGGEPAAAATGAERAELDGLGDCLRRHGAPLGDRAAGDPADLPPAPFDDDAFAAAAAACGMTDPPPGTDPFPLSDDQIAAETKRLEAYVNCMRARGQSLGDPVVERDRIAIELGPGAFSEEFLAAQRECGGPPA